jgi:RNA polymerase sigma-70 factor (family 1)
LSLPKLLLPENIKYEEFKLIEMLSNDSEYAFQLIYDTHRNRIYNTAIRFLKSPILAQDVVQDVFLKLWIKRGSIRTDQPIEAWLYVVARNNIFNRLKRLGYEWNTPDIPAETTNASVNENSFIKCEEFELKEYLTQAINTLPEQQRKAFQLSRFEGLSYNQIADKLKISPLTVKTHIARATAHLKLFLAKKGINPPF